MCCGDLGRGAEDASAGGSSAQQRSRDAAAAAARAPGKGPGDFALCGVRAAAGRARKAAKSDCASGATSAGVTLGGSGAAVRARLGGGSAIGQGTRTRNGVGYHASGDARWSRRAGAAHRSRGVLRPRQQNGFDARSAAMARCSAASEMGTSMAAVRAVARSYAGGGLLGAAAGMPSLRRVSGIKASTLLRWPLDVGFAWACDLPLRCGPTRAPNARYCVLSPHGLLPANGAASQHVETPKR